MAFSPDGKYLAYDLPEADNTEKRDVFVIAVDGSREIPVAASPSEDTFAGWSNDTDPRGFFADLAACTH